MTTPYYRGYLGHMRLAAGTVLTGLVAVILVTGVLAQAFYSVPGAFGFNFGDVLVYDIWYGDGFLVQVSGWEEILAPFWER